MVPIDFSPRSLELLEYARAFAGKFGATVHLAHVYEPDHPLTNVMGMPLALPPVQVAQGIRRHLKDLAKKYGLDLLPGHAHAIEGRPFEEICQLARRHAIDLILVATRGNTGIKHLLLGSTAERIVRYSPCPVLVVHPGAKDGHPVKPEVNFRKILVPIDFSECSLKGFAYARALAGQFEAKLIVLNSVAFQYYITSDEYARYDLPLLLEQEERASRRQMREFMEKTDWEGVEASASLQIGHAGQQVCSQAVDRKVDLIVISTHGATGFKHVLVGSTAEYVVQHATCPVLVVPGRERALPGAKERS
jgi:nucleotide-binding universal stress UspA family protein